MAQLGKGEMTKTYTDSYLYTKSINIYEKKLVDFLMRAEMIDKQDESFQDIKYDVKRRQVTNVLTKVLDSEKIILLTQPVPLPKAFKVFMSKDIKGDKKNKIFIDADVVKKIDGVYQCVNTDILVAYLTSAMTQVIYYSDPKRLLLRNEIVNIGANIFSKLFTHIVDYLYKISNTTSIKNRVRYLSMLYYYKNILKKDINDVVRNKARKESGLSEREEELLNIAMSDDWHINIDIFIKELSRVLRLPKLTLDLFLEKWIYLYGVGTQFALELFPAFAMMMTNVYIGCYLNNQKTIEKIVGRELVQFCTAIFSVGGESV